MSKSNAFETELLDLIFVNLAIANIGNVAGLQPSGVPGDLFVSLHTADPGETGDQGTSEAAYGNYARQAVPRSVAGWAVAGDTVDNVAVITFPTSSNGPETETHFGIGAELSGATLLLYSGILTASLIVNNGVTPEFAIGDCNVTED